MKEWPLPLAWTFFGLGAFGLILLLNSAGKHNATGAEIACYWMAWIAPAIGAILGVAGAFILSGKRIALIVAGIMNIGWLVIMASIFYLHIL